MGKSNATLLTSVEIGAMDRRVRLEEATATRSGFGEEVRAWGLVAEVWAAVTVTTANSGEEVIGDQLQATTRTVFTIRHRAVNEKMRIVWRGTNYDILVIEPLGRDDLLKIQTQAQG